MRDCGDNDGMTDQAVSPSTQSPKKAQKPYFVPFHAVIKVQSTVKLLSDTQVEIALGSQTVTLPIAVSQRERIQSQSVSPEQVYFVRLWFRTEEGAVTHLEVAGFSTLKEEEGKADKKPYFEIAGRLEAINKEEGLVTVKIEPNSVSDLQEPFSVEVWASLELLEQVQRPGRIMIFSGEYRPGSGRLVMTTVKPKLVGQPQKKSETTAEVQ